MHISNIEMSNGSPTGAKVDLSLDELVAIAKVFGRFSPHKAEESGLEYSVTSEIYGCLVGELFNRFWDAGVDGVGVSSDD